MQDGSFDAQHQLRAVSVNENGLGPSLPVGPPRPKRTDQDGGWQFADLDEATLREARAGAARSWETHAVLQRGRLRAVELVEAKAKTVAWATNAAFLAGLSSAGLMLKGTPGLIPVAIGGLLLLLLAFFLFGFASGVPVSPLVSGMKREDILEPEMKFEHLDIVTPVGIPIHRTTMMVGLSAVALVLIFGTAFLGAI